MFKAEHFIQIVSSSLNTFSHVFPHSFTRWQILRKGLVKAARTTGAWILTGGTNTGNEWFSISLVCSIFQSYYQTSGVTKQVGDALLVEGQQRSGRLVSIGIAPWGIVERNHELLGHNRDVPCHSISSPR